MLHPVTQERNGSCSQLRWDLAGCHNVHNELIVRMDDGCSSKKFVHEINVWLAMREIALDVFIAGNKILPDKFIAPLTTHNHLHVLKVHVEQVMNRIGGRNVCSIPCM